MRSPAAVSPEQNDKLVFGSGNKAMPSEVKRQRNLQVTNDFLREAHLENYLRGS